MFLFPHASKGHVKCCSAAVTQTLSVKHKKFVSFDISEPKNPSSDKKQHSFVVTKAVSSLIIKSTQSLKLFLLYKYVKSMEPGKSPVEKKRRPTIPW